MLLLFDDIFVLSFRNVTSAKSVWQPWQKSKNLSRKTGSWYVRRSWAEITRSCCPTAYHRLKLYAAVAWLFLFLYLWVVN